MSRRTALFIAIIVAVGICVYFYFDPNDSTFFPRCPFLSLTGLQCPGCGSQRAIHALLHGDIADAWSKNALLVMSLPLVAALIFSEATRTKYPRFYRKMNSGFVIKLCLIIVIGWWILRNIINNH